MRQVLSDDEVARLLHVVLGADDAAAVELLDWAQGVRVEQVVLEMALEGEIEFSLIEGELAMRRRGRRPHTRWELIGDEPRPYFADDPATAAFPDDGRMEPEA